MAREIIWTDRDTGQKFVLDDSGEKIFILADGSRVYESDLILDEMLREYEEEEDERRKIEEAEEELRRQEKAEAARLEEEEEEYYYYNFLDDLK